MVLKLKCSCSNLKVKITVKHMLMQYFSNHHFTWTQVYSWPQTSKMFTPHRKWCFVLPVSIFCVLCRFWEIQSILLHYFHSHVVTVSYYKCCRPNQHFTSNQWLSHLTWNIVSDFKNVCCATNMQFIFNKIKYHIKTPYINLVNWMWLIWLK